MTLFKKVLTTKELMKQLKIDNMHFRIGDFVGRQWFSLARNYRLETNKLIYYIYCIEKNHISATYLGAFTIGKDDIYIEEDDVIITMKCSEDCNVLLLSKSSIMEELPENFFNIPERHESSFNLGTFNCLHKDYVLNNFE